MYRYLHFKANKNFFKTFLIRRRFEDLAKSSIKVQTYMAVLIYSKKGGRRSMITDNRYSLLTLLDSKASALCSSFCLKQLVHLLLLKMLGENFLQSDLPDIFTEVGTRDQAYVT